MQSPPVWSACRARLSLPPLSSRQAALETASPLEGATAEGGDCVGLMADQWGAYGAPMGLSRKTIMHTRTAQPNRVRCARRSVPCGTTR